MSACEFCAHYLFDEEEEVYYCDVSLDEDDMDAYLRASTDDCGFFRLYDEYKMVEKQN